MSQNMKKLLQHYREYRPYWHFTSPSGWINDPNGLIFADGYYHLYYQYYPGGVTHGPMHWGHARSADLLEWEVLPVALYPDEQGEIFSGSMVCDRENTAGFGRHGDAPLVAVFTHHRERNGKVRQAQSLAYSLDGGLSFEKFPGNPVLDLGLRDFRDPRVFWYEPQRQWIMLAVAGKEVRFFASPDLKSWKYLSVFRAGGLSEEEIWECPDLFPLESEEGEKRWVLLVSANTLDYHHTGILYYVGNFDGIRFEAEEKESNLRLDFGRDNYAAVTYGGIKERTVIQGWMSCWAYAEKVPERGFRGAMTIPRELGLKKTQAGWRMVQRPIRELYGAGVKDVSLAAEGVTALTGEPVLLRLKWKGESCCLRFGSENGPGEILLCIEAEKRRISMERRGCPQEGLGEDYRAVCEMGFLENGREQLLEILLDVTSIEVFFAGGETVGTMQYFSGVPLNRLEVVHQ